MKVKRSESDKKLKGEGKKKWTKGKIKENNERRNKKKVGGN